MLDDNNETLAAALDEAFVGVCVLNMGGVLVERRVYDGLILVECLAESTDMPEESVFEDIFAALENPLTGASAPLIMWPLIDHLDS
jgi:hypothetical protein